MEAHNKEILAKIDAGTLTAEAAIRALTPLPKQVEMPTKSWCRHFLRNFGYSLLSNGCDTQAWLPYSHPDMETSRAHMRDLLQSKCHPALVLNYDQMWRTAFSFGGKLLWKDRQDAGRRCLKRKVGPKTDKKQHHIKGSRRSITVSRMSMLRDHGFSSKMMSKYEQIIVYINALAATRRQTTSLFLHKVHFADVPVSGPIPFSQSSLGFFLLHHPEKTSSNGQINADNPRGPHVVLERRQSRPHRFLHSRAGNANCRHQALQ